MPSADERNILRIGRTTDGTITAAMVQAVRARIAAAGGALTIWAVLHEDVYETTFGDGFYLHACGIALNRADADRLVALAPVEQFARWHVKTYVLGLSNDMPILLEPWPLSEEFTIGTIVEILAEIAPGRTTSKLKIDQTRSGREPGPHMLALPADSPGC